MKWERAAHWLVAATASGTMLLVEIVWGLPLRRPPISASAWLATLLLTALFVISVMMTRRGLADAEPATEDLDDFLAFINRSRTERLALARRYLPRRLPAGWSKLTTGRRSVAWRFQVGNVLVRTWADRTRFGGFVRVAMSRPGSDKQVDTTDAAAVLEHFRDIAEFIEVDTPPPALSKEHPGIRFWCANAKDTVAALAKPCVPARVSAPPESPLRELVRVLLPKTLPPGWSPPVGMEEIEDGWSMIVDEQLVMAMPVSEGVGLKLMVTILGDREDPVSVAGAIDVLRHIRGVGDFQQIQGPEELPGGRSFIADIRGTEGVPLPRKRNQAVN